MKLPTGLCTAAVCLGLGLSGTAAALEEGKLTVWYGLGYQGMEKVGERFTEDTGIPVTVEHPEDIPAKFQQAAAAGKGPDIVIWAHDRAGEWAKSGLIRSITPSPEMKDAMVDIGWEAFTFDGKTWGWPMRIEAVALVYNKGLVGEPPASFEAVKELDAQLADQGKKAILWDYANTYFTWPLLAANGGYVFAQDDQGNYDVSDTGVNHEGAVQGARVLVDLIESGVMPRGAQYADMEAGMNKGEIAMMINGPWSWENLRASGIDFGVAPIPTVNGAEAEPFVGVVGAMINRASPNPDLAKEFIENHLLTVDGLSAVNDAVPIGTPALQAFYEQLADDPNIRATMQSAQAGEPMPAVPEMGRFWSAMASALENITQGRQGVEEGLDSAAQRITSE